MLELKEIVKIYGTKKNSQKVLALNGVSTKFGETGFISILGPSGCGKTSLLNIIGGLDKYSSGSLIVNGLDTIDFRDSNWDSYRNRYIGFVFQNYNLIHHQTVIKNVEVALTLSGASKTEQRRKAKQMLISVGLEDQMRKKIHELSGGQMQRVAIARAISNEPKIILADEPTGALDSITSVQIMEVLKKISETKLVIMVTHNEELAQKYSSRIIRMKDGKIVSDENLDSQPGNVEGEFPKEGPIEGQPGNVEGEFPKEGQIEGQPGNVASEPLNKNQLKKTSMKFSSALSLSFGNLKTKKGRTILTAIATSIGLCVMAIMFALVNGCTDYAKKTVGDVMSKCEISIFDGYSRLGDEELEEVSKKEKDDENKKAKEQPDGNTIIVEKESKRSKYEAYSNKITNEYVDYVRKMKENLPVCIKDIDYVRDTQLNPIFNIGGIPTTSPKGAARYYYESTKNYLKKLSKSEEELKEKYDFVGEGSKYPKNIDEVLIQVDNRNRLSEDMSAMLDLGDKENVNPADILNKKVLVKLFTNDEFYTEIHNEHFIKPDLEKAKELYNDGSKGISLKVVGIIKPKKGIDNWHIYNSNNIYYTPELEAKLYEASVNSKLAKAQSKNNEINLIKEERFWDERDRLEAFKKLGCTDCPISKIKITATTPENFEKVKQHLLDYNKNKPMNERIRFFDEAEQARESLGSTTTIAYVVMGSFSGVALMVAILMIALLTYVSVLERKKEIGILRAFGARKKDISRVFNAETTLLGLLAGLIAMVSATLISLAANAIISAVISKQAKDHIEVKIFSPHPIHWLFVIGSGILITLIAGLIPSKMAANKNPVEALKSE